MNYWLIALLTLLAFLYVFFKLRFSYWKLRGVKQLANEGLWNNIGKLTTMHHSGLIQEVYDEFKNKEKLAGTYIFTKPIAVVLDLDLAKMVLIKDFHTFYERSAHANPKEILDQHLFAAEGKLWKSLRGKLTPAFSSGKMKYMFPSLVEVAQSYALALAKELETSSNQCVDMQDWNARFTTDVIGICVFGVQCHSLKDPSEEFRQMGLYAFRVNNYNVRWRLLKIPFMKYLSLLGVRYFNRKLENFFVRLVQDTVLERERRNIRSKDFIDILIELKKKSLLTLDQIAAQLFIFFAAGFETSSSNLSYSLFELAKNPGKQEKLRQEILRILQKHNNHLTYEAMMETEYLDQVITETLRLYPALAFLQRICMQDYKVPGTNITLAKGTIVFIPAKAIHSDPNIYENPLEFRPERFEPLEVCLRHPQSFLGFGDGPRNCIGLRFGRMQVKVVLMTLLSKYRFSVAAKMPMEMEISKYSFVLVPAKGVWLRVDKLEEEGNR